MSDPLKVACPCCGARLTVDASSGEVLTSERSRGTPKSFEQAMGEVRSGNQRREDAFSQAFEKTRNLEDVLEKKFQEARKKAADDTSPPRNPFDAD